MSFLNKLFGVGNKETPNERITDADGGMTELMRLAFVGNGDSLVGTLLTPGAKHNVNAKDKYGRTALMYAASRGNGYFAKNLISLEKKNVDVNARDKNGWTALMFASGVGSVSCVKALIEAGADVNAKGNDGRTALRIAKPAFVQHYQNGDEVHDVAAVLRDAGARE